MVKPSPPPVIPDSPKKAKPKGKAKNVRVPSSSLAPHPPVSLSSVCLLCCAGAASGASSAGSCCTGSGHSQAGQARGCGQAGARALVLPRPSPSRLTLGCVPSLLRRRRRCRCQARRPSSSSSSVVPRPCPSLSHHALSHHACPHLSSWSPSTSRASPSRMTRPLPTTKSFARCAASPVAAHP